MASAARQLVNTPPATPPFDIMRAAFVELQVTDLAASEHFYAGLLGMIVSARTEDAVLPARLGGAPAPLADPRAAAPVATASPGWASASAPRMTWTAPPSTSRARG